MICFFNGHNSQPIQPLLLLRYILMSFDLEKDHPAVATVTDVRNNNRAVHTSPHRRWMLRSDNPRSASWKIGRLTTAEQSALKQALNDRSCARNVIAMSLL